MSTPPLRDPIEALGRSVAPGGRPRSRRPEVWAWFAFGLFAALVALFGYLGARPGGVTPVLVYRFGPQLIGLAAVVTGFVGVAWSLMHRPVLRRRRIPAFLCLVVVIGVTGNPFPYPSSHEGHPSSICFRLPVDGEWTVFWGGETKELNRLAGYFPDRRWGLDLVVARDGRTHGGEGLDLEDYYAFGADVRAPAAGVVVRAVGGLPDSQPRMLERGVDPHGNHLVIEVGEGEYLFLLHLQEGSVVAAAGDTVEAGQLVARVGNSGWSTVTPEPHLALHLQDTPDAHRGEAVPWRFCRYRADGVEIQAGLPRGGVHRGGALLGERIEALRD